MQTHPYIFEFANANLPIRSIYRRIGKLALANRSSTPCLSSGKSAFLQPKHTSRHHTFIAKTPSLSIMETDKNHHKILLILLISITNTEQNNGFCKQCNIETNECYMIFLYIRKFCNDDKMRKTRKDVTLQPKS